MEDKIKREILNKYRQLKEQLGHKPSSREFFESSGINRRDLQRNFGKNAYSKLMKEAGDTPNIFSSPGKSIEELLSRWGGMVRKIRAIPTEADWHYHKFSPSTEWFRRKFGGLPKIPEKFREFALGKKEWEDVIELLPKSAQEQVGIREPLYKENLDEEDIYQFLPPILSNLSELGSIEGKSIEFEKKVNLAFQMLGFNVKFLGQGSGRNPDGIARDSQNHYAIIFDAKARKDGYSFGTDDRTIIEYISAYKNNLLKDGFEKIYFLIVSNRFNAFSRTNINRIIKATTIPVILVKTEDLLSLVYYRIKNPARFDLGVLQDLFIESGELDKKKLEKLIV